MKITRIKEKNRLHTFKDSTYIYWKNIYIYNRITGVESL